MTDDDHARQQAEADYRQEWAERLARNAQIGEAIGLYWARPCPTCGHIFVWRRQAAPSVCAECGAIREDTWNEAKA